MPIEIRELIIKTKIASDQGQTSSATVSPLTEVEIKTLANKVIELIKEKNER